MLIDSVSDLHGSYPRMKGGDLLIVAGDLTAADLGHQYAHFRMWLQDLKYRKKIVVAGNHDGLIQGGRWNIDRPEGFDYLQDQAIEFEGLKIYGSPWTPSFCDWHFMKMRGQELREIWGLIPRDTDILITHGPPNGILDQVEPGEEHLGCIDLWLAVKKIKPMMHVFGHIHGGYGQKTIEYGQKNPENGRKKTIFVNAAHCNEHYEPFNKPIRVIL